MIQQVNDINLFLKENEVLKIQDLIKSYNKNKIVLDNINFSVQENEIFGIIGLNGSGKTTLIKIILNLINANNGFLGIKNNYQIFYLPENFQPIDLLTGYEFIQFSNDFFHKKSIRKEIDELACRFSLEVNFLSQKIKNYSKGMRQKIGLISAFISDAQILILDEPMSGLDPLARVGLKNEIINYHKKNKTVIFSSHILHDVQELCDRIMIINNKKINFLGTISELIGPNNHNNFEQIFLEKVSN